MTIRVLTVKGQPEFEYFANDAEDVDMIVQMKYGRQPDGSPYNWEGISSV